jgi:hypothetical protein
LPPVVDVGILPSSHSWADDVDDHHGPRVPSRVSRIGSGQALDPPSADPGKHDGKAQVDRGFASLQGRNRVKIAARAWANHLAEPK